MQLDKQLFYEQTSKYGADGLMATPQERTTSNLNEFFCEQADELCLPEVSSGFLFCLPAICSCFSETPCFHLFPCFAAPRYLAPFSVVSNLSTIHIDWSRTFVLNGRLKEYALTESGQRIYSGFDTELYLPRTSDKSQFPTASPLGKSVELS